MRNHRFFVLSLAVLAAAMIVSWAYALAESKLPSAEKILDRYVEALGGVKAFDKIHSSIAKANLEIPAMGIKIDITVYAARPNKFYSIAESPMIGKIERGTDGKIFWEKSTMGGARILEGEELEEALNDARFEGLVYWRTTYDSVAVSGIDTVEGKPAYEVILKAKNLKSRRYFFDPSTGLLVKTVSTAKTQMGDIDVVSHISDYRKVGNVLQSHRTKMNIMGQERIVTVSSIEQNISIPDSIFAIPPDIVELMKAQKETEKRTE